MGKIELDHTGSGSGITLSSDGTSLLLGGTAIGGGGGSDPDLYAENYTTGTQPATTGTNAVAIGKGSSAAGTEAIAMVDGTADSQDSFAVGGIVQSAIGGYAIGKSAQVYSQYGLALGQSALVSAASYGTAVGYQAVAGANSAVGLAKSRASGADSLAGAIANNSSSYGATGANSIAMGYQAKATSSDAISVGRLSQSTGTRSVALGMSYASGQDSFAAAIDSTSSSYGAQANNSIAMGRECKAEAALSVAIGDRSWSSVPNSVAIGTTAYTRAKGHIAFGSGADTGYSSTDSGRAQSGIIVIRGTSGDAVQKTLVSDGALETIAATDNDNQLIVPSYGAIAFDGLIVAREKASTGTDCAAWKVEGLIRRENAANTTTLVNSAITVINNAPSWGLALEADTTNGALNVKVTGAASTNVRWVCTLRSSETWYS